MKTKIIVLSLIVLSTLWCADVLAHPSPIRHFAPCTDNDPSVDNEQDKQDCIDEGYLGGHGHVDETHDGTSTGEASSWGYWDACGYAAATGTSTEDCDDITTPPPPPPPPPPSTFSIHVVSGPGSGAPGAQLTFVVEVRENETAASGQSVTFRITSGDGNATLGTPNPATTGANGQAQTTITLESDASGSYTITATSNGVSTTGTATVTNSDGNGGGNTPEFSIVVISGPGSGAPGDTLTFVVEVRKDGTAEPSQGVTFSVSPNDGNVTLGTTSATADSNGRAQTTLELGAGATGSYTITATLDSDTTVSVAGTATVITSPPPQFSIVVISGPGSGAPGDTLTFVVEVREDGTATSGETVDFSITAGDGNATLGSTSETTGSNGRAQTTLELGNSASGSYTITATLDSDSTVSVSGTATVTTSPPPPQYTIVVISGPGSGAPGDTLTFVVEVREDGTAEPNQSVTFSITSGDGNATLGTPNPATTGNDGQAEIDLMLGNNASGSYTITATNNGNSVTGTATVQTSPPDPQFSIVVISGPGSGAPGDTLTFVVEVREDGTATSGETVDFSITAGDGNATLGSTSETTGSNGRAQTTLELGASAIGSYIITATSNDQSVNGTATVTTGGNNGGNNERNSGGNNGNNEGNNGNNGGNNGENNGGGNNQQPDIQQRSNPESDQARCYAFQLNLYAGWNFVHVPLEVTQVDRKPTSIETVGDLFQVLMPAHMYIYDDSCWLAVFGDSTQELGANQGIIVYMDAPLTVNLVGSPLPTNFVIQRGLTFVGLPRQPPTSLRKISDFFTVYPNVRAVLVASKGQSYLVGRAGDSGDVPITGGQAFAFIATEQYMTNFTGAAWGKVLPK